MMKEDVEPRQRSRGAGREIHTFAGGLLAGGEDFFFPSAGNLSGNLIIF